jgi:ATP-dependent RNA helicase RhlE
MTVAIDTTNSTLQQGVYYVARHNKYALLEHIITKRELNNTIIFARTKYSADTLARHLSRSGISAEALHGDQSKKQYSRTLSNFRTNKTRILVSTDQAVRCMDIVNLPAVINYELPDSAETYTNRIKHTGRTGRAGMALSLCDRDERGQLKNINRMLGDTLEILEHPFL